MADLLPQVGRQAVEEGGRRVDDQVGLQDDPEIVLGHGLAVGILHHALVEHAGEVAVVVGVPPVGADIDRALASAITAFSWLPVTTTLEKYFSALDVALVQRIQRHVVAGGRVRIDQAEILALQIRQRLVRASAST